MVDYMHVGKNIHLMDDCYEYFDKYNYNRWWKYSLFTCWNVSDHDIDLYYENIESNEW